MNQTTSTRLVNSNQFFELKNYKYNSVQTDHLTNHKIYTRLVSFLENKQIEFRGKILHCIFHPRTVENLLKTGWTQAEIDESERFIFNYAGYMRDCRILQDVPANLFYELEKRDQTNLIFDNRIVPIPGFFF